MPTNSCLIDSQYRQVRYYLGSPEYNREHIQCFIAVIHVLVDRHGKSEGFDSCERPSNLTQVGFKSPIFTARVILKFNGWHWKTIGHLFYTRSSFVHHFKAMGKFNWSFKLETINSGQHRWFCPAWPWNLMDDLFYATSIFVHHFIAIGEFKLEFKFGNAKFGSKSTFFTAVWPWNLIDDLENNRAPHLCYLKLCASLHSHQWIKPGVTVRKRPIWVKIGDFLSLVTFKFDRWPPKSIGHLLYATSSLVHYFVVIGEFKLELQSGKSRLRSKSTVFLATWPWNLMDDLEKQQGTSPKEYQALCVILSPYVNLNSSCGPETAKLGFELCDLYHWPLTFTWTPLLSLVIIPEHFMKRWWEYGEKGVTDEKNGQTDGRVDLYWLYFEKMCLHILLCRNTEMTQII